MNIKGGGIKSAGALVLPLGREGLSIFRGGHLPYVIFLRYLCIMKSTTPMPSYALIRQPHADRAYRLTQTCGEPEEVVSYAALNGRSGFVFAPFASSPACPILLLHPDRWEEVELPVGGAAPEAGLRRPRAKAADRARYAREFALFHAKLREGAFAKLVLARSAVEDTERHEPPELLFRRACALYPRMFIALVHTARSGTWLMATPEILLEGNSRGECSTMALAGSMRLADDQMGFDAPAACGSRPVVWNEKNREEQDVVATYIGERLGRLVGEVEQTEPYTVRAGRMVHLRTDFRFRIGRPDRLGDVIDCLHPTPAVCGLPKQEALRFILATESCERKYYSGFCGLLRLGGQTRLYVSLRCMQLTPQGYVLHAGGGLLVESGEAEEWQETQDKMDTMRMVLQGGQASS